MRANEKKEINILVGENIRIYREKSGYSREKLAELGFVGVSLTTLKCICETLGISADRILWKHENKEIEISERLSHINPEFLSVIEELIQKQLEVIELVSNSENKKGTRK